MVSAVIERVFFRLIRARPAGRGAARYLAIGASASAMLGAPAAFAEGSPRYHDGLYLRAAVGASHFSDAVENDDFLRSKAEGTVTGYGAAANIAVGWSVRPGLAVGGAFLWNWIASPSSTNPRLNGIPLGQLYGTNEVDFDATTLTLLGPFVDFYPDPSGGLHVLACLGYGISSLGAARLPSGTELIAGQSGSGFAAAIGGGYEWWLNDAWSLGVLGEVFGAVGSTEDVNHQTWHHEMLTPGLFVSATMN